MKKIYQHPEINVVRVQTAQMIATSPGYGGSTTETDGNLGRDDEPLLDEPGFGF